MSDEFVLCVDFESDLVVDVIPKGHSIGKKYLNLEHAPLMDIIISDGWTKHKAVLSLHQLVEQGASPALQAELEKMLVDGIVEESTPIIIMGDWCFRYSK